MTNRWVGDTPIKRPLLFCRWNCWNKFCIAALNFNNTVFCWDSWDRNLKGCVRGLLSHYEEKKVCAKAFKPLHIQEQIPIIDLGWVSLSLLFIRSHWSVFISPPSAKQTKTHIHILCKLLVVRNAFAGGSQEELLESYQPILVGSSLTKGSSRLHTEYTSGHQCEITLWLNIFCFKGGAVFRKMGFPPRAVPCKVCMFYQGVCVGGSLQVL